MERPRKIKLGEMLKEAGLITEEQLNIALEEKETKKQRLGRVLINLGFITEDLLLSTLAKQLKLGYVDLKKINIEKLEFPDVKDIEKLFHKHNIIPLYKEDSTLVIAISDPLDFVGLEQLEKTTRLQLRVVLAKEVQIKEALNYFYKRDSVLENILKEIPPAKLQELPHREEIVDIERIDGVERGEAPIIRMVSYFISEALNLGASDIHLEPYENVMRVRYRVDGVLYDINSCPLALHPAIVSRIKIMSGLDIAEKRLPQDGRCKVNIKGKVLDLRISIIPTGWGEKVAIRLLDPSSLCMNLTDLGFESDSLKLYQEKIRTPYGMLLITGPTGSGKTTTLYSTLITLNQPDKHILTIEDPIEYMIEGINQVQAKPDIGLEFAAGLRAFVRQDPDIILVGEIRDKETAEVAINAALTGHLVFATLHTNDAVGAITRLQNMGVEPFLIASTVILSVAQRLMRKICKNCKEEYKPSLSLLSSLDLDKERAYWHGKGCNFCNNTGYRGRIGVFELLPISKSIADMIIEREPALRIKEVALEEGMITLREAAKKKVYNGISTIEELARLTLE